MTEKQTEMKYLKAKTYSIRFIFWVRLVRNNYYVYSFKLRSQKFGNSQSSMALRWVNRSIRFKIFRNFDRKVSLLLQQKSFKFGQPASLSLSFIASELKQPSPFSVQ